MRALTVVPGQPDSAEMADVDEPSESDGALLVEAVTVGVCGTDREIVAGNFGRAPDGEDRLILGHEAVGRVIDAPAASGFELGELVVGFVRRPDPLPCPQCEAGEYDRCVNGRYSERGVIGRHGYAAERYRLEPAYAVKVGDTLGDLGVLLEPASILAKAWEQVDAVGRARQPWRPRRALVLGAGPIGLLAALLCAERDLDVCVVDRIDEGAKPELVRRLGATHLTDSSDLGDETFDVCFECSGTTDLALAALDRTAATGVTALIGITTPGDAAQVDLGGLYRQMVMRNQLVIATVTANRRHFHEAHERLEAADRRWLGQLITRRLPFDAWSDALAPAPEHVKTVMDLAAR